MTRALWLRSEVGDNEEAKKEGKELNENAIFGTPKPERLLQRILEVSTQPGDLILDSFAGSGTTGAVAHKMGRRWIMIELGEHIHSHIIPRMKKVIDGEDPGGVTGATGWKGGGGFRYFRLAPSLLELDRFGNHVISREYNPAHARRGHVQADGIHLLARPGALLAAGPLHRNPTDFLYTTTQTLSRQQLESLSEEVGPNRTLMVCCSAFRAKAADFPNLTLRKIPMAVLARCEWGKDDYSLNVAKPSRRHPRRPKHKTRFLSPPTPTARRPAPPTPASAAPERSGPRTRAQALSSSPPPK